MAENVGVMLRAAQKACSYPEISGHACNKWSRMNFKHVYGAPMGNLS